MVIEQETNGVASCCTARDSELLVLEEESLRHIIQLVDRWLVLR